MTDHYEDTGLTGRAWFKPLVALWFGALAAAGMWFMPPGVHSAIVRATGLANAHPIFAEPLSSTGVLVLCAAIGLLGAILGFLIAWRIAAAGSSRGFAPGFSAHDDNDWAEDEGFEEPRRRRVFSAREDIGEEGIAISAPMDGDEAEADYESEYSIDEIPPVTPEEDFEAVYAGLDADYVPAEDGEEPMDEAPIEPAPEPEPEPQSEPEYADFEEVPLANEEPQFEPSVETISEPLTDNAQDEALPESAEAEEAPADPAEESQPLGDMSLDALVGRLGSALDQHRRLVADSEEAAREPAPRTIPMTREPEPAEEDTDHGLPEVADDDPVIAFLRREASRRMPAGEGAQASPGEDVKPATKQSAQSDAQAALRSALDRLGEANRRDS